MTVPNFTDKLKHIGQDFTDKLKHIGQDLTDKLKHIGHSAIVVVAFLSTCIAAEPCRVQPLPQSAENSFGVNINFTEPRFDEVKLIAAAGFKWIRMDFKWDQTEVVRGQYDFSAYDRLLDELDKKNIRALLILDYGNPLYDNGAPPRNDKTRRAFTRWAVAAARHYENRGVMWELYNEPNHQQFWPRPNVAEYIALANEVGKAFRENVPNEMLVGPAVSEMDFEFLEACLKAGLLKYWSAVSVHPYRRSDPESVASDYCKLRRLIDEYDSTEKKQTLVISSEWGYSTAWPNVDSTRQAELMVRTLLTNIANGISLSIWYDWRNGGNDSRNPEHNFGTINYDFSLKPAYLAAAQLKALLTGYRFVRRVETGREEDYVLEFAREKDTRFIAWTTGTQSREVRVTQVDGTYEVSEYSGKKTRVLKSSSGGLKLDLSNAPIFVIKK